MPNPHGQFHIEVAENSELRIAGQGSHTLGKMGRRFVVWFTAFVPTTFRTSGATLGGRQFRKLST